MIKKLKFLAKKMKAEIGTLYYSYKDKRTPIVAKVVSVVVVAYALSPIDLIPDFIPVLGYLDDLIILPLGIYLALKLIPDEVIYDSKAKADQLFDKLKLKFVVPAIIIVLIWISLVIYLVSIFVR
jgi:uncharacterized membrane protein YkvA (DUF1232 family)